MQTKAVVRSPSHSRLVETPAVVRYDAMNKPFPKKSLLYALFGS